MHRYVLTTYRCTNAITKKLLFFLLTIIFIIPNRSFGYNTVHYDYVYEGRTGNNSLQDFVRQGIIESSFNSSNAIVEANRGKNFDFAIIQSIKAESLPAVLSNIERKDLFKNYHLYTCANYLNYIRNLCGYEEFIIDLHDKIHDNRNNHSFRKSLRWMTGFNGKTGFQNFIDQECERICKKRRDREIQKQEKLRQQKLVEAAAKAKLNWLKCEIKRSENGQIFKQTDNIQKNKEIISKYDPEDKLVQMAQHQINSFEIEYANGLRQRSIIYKKRINAIVKTLKSSNKNISSSYDLDEYSKEYIKHYNFDLDKFTKLQGNFIQENIHKEVLDLIKHTSYMRHSFEDTLNTKNISKLIFQSSDIALDLKDNHDYERAYSLLDVVNGIFDIGKKSILALGKGLLKSVGEFSEEIKNSIDRLANSSREDIINGAIDIVRGLYYCLRTSPITLDYMINKMNKKDVQINSSDIFPGYLDYCVSKIHYGERKEPFPSYEEWKPIIQQQFDAFDVKQKKDIQSWLNKLKTNKEQFTIDTISEVTKTFLYWGLCDIAVFKIGELAKTFSDVMSAELQILVANSRELRAAKNGIFDVKTIEVVDAQFFAQ